jgi:hypothetical protein
LLVLVFSGKNWNTSVKFSQNASGTPYVYVMTIRYPHGYFWSPVVSRLDISVKGFLFEATRPEIYDFNAGFIVLFEQYVLWLQITMNDLITS